MQFEICAHVFWIFLANLKKSNDSKAQGKRRVSSLNVLNIFQLDLETGVLHICVCAHTCLYFLLYTHFPLF